MACLERKNRLHWQSIHRGWEWIRKDLRSRLRAEWERIYVNDTSFSKHHKMVSNTSNLKEKSFANNEIENETCSELIVINDVTNDKSKKKKLTNIEKSHPNYQAYHTCEESAAYVTAIRSEALELKQSIKQSETLRKTLRKLTNLNWVLCYERFARSSFFASFYTLISISISISINISKLFPIFILFFLQHTHSYFDDTSFFLWISFYFLLSSLLP